MKRKLIYLFIAFAAAILPAHAQKFLNDALTLSNVSLWQQGNSLLCQHDLRHEESDNRFRPKFKPYSPADGRAA